MFNNIAPSSPSPSPPSAESGAAPTWSSGASAPSRRCELQSTLAPFGILESPAPETVSARQRSAQGWASTAAASARSACSSTAPRLTSSTSARAPPSAAVAPLPDCPAPGFSLDPTSRASPCPHLLEIEAVDSDGNARVIARQRINVGQGGGASACGDGVCSEGEDSQGCPADCGPSCGDGVCSPGETCPEECEAEEQGTVLLHRYLYASGGDQDHMFGVDTAPPAGTATRAQPSTSTRARLQGSSPLPTPRGLQTTSRTSPNEGAPAYTGHTLLGYVGAQRGLTPNPLQRVYGAAQSDHFVTGNAGEVNALQSSAAPWRSSGRLEASVPVAQEVDGPAIEAFHLR